MFPQYFATIANGSGLRFFDAGQASSITEVVLSAVRGFNVELSQLHNDSTTVTFTGNYPTATGTARAGVTTAKITHGHNKDHRPWADRVGP